MKASIMAFVSEKEPGYEQSDPTEEQLAEYRRNSTENLGGLLAGSVLVAVLGDPTAKCLRYLRHDGPLAAAILMLAARARGYGTVYGTNFVAPSVVRQTLGIPNESELICTIAIGVPEAWPEAPEKNTLDSFLIREGFE
ncbi:nitroreductase family protein [Candidatus Bipolaricaulota bacterium]